MLNFLMAIPFTLAAVAPMNDVINSSAELNRDLRISFDEKSYTEKNEIRLNGSYSTFVNCGSQYAIWYQFPKAIRYTVKDLDSGEVYMSIDNQLSISHSGNQIYETYSKKDCGKVVTESFSVSLNDIYFIKPAAVLKNIEVSCSYFNHPSNVVKILNKSIRLKGF
ncbi:MAG: hypothetical protein ABW044_01050 [Cellvibrio sp.]